jgi:hypothetical protein
MQMILTCSLQKKQPMFAPTADCFSGKRKAAGGLYERVQDTFYHIGHCLQGDTDKHTQGISFPRLLPAIQALQQVL